MQYLELNLVRPTATKAGMTDRVILEEIAGGSFVEKRGDIGIRVGRRKERTSQPYPMTQWDAQVQRYLTKGYLIVPGRTAPAERKIVDTRSGDFRPEETREAEDLVTLLREMAKNAMAEAFDFSLSVDALTPEQILEGQQILDDLSDTYKDLSIPEFNRLLCRFYSIVPRRMKFLADFLAHGKDSRGRRLSAEDTVKEKAELLARERDYFRTVVDLLQDNTVCDLRKTATETFGLQIRGISREETAWIKKMLGSLAPKFLRAWSISNSRTAAAFDAFCAREHLTEAKGIDHLFHGSRGENWWSITKGGLTINPKDVVITGKAYGIGTYFAPNAEKSIGYTDRNGSRWANGTQSVGYMGIYRVATGKRYDGSKGPDSSLNWSKLQKICPGAHCTWAERRYSGFHMDEVIVYQDDQSDIEYLVEISA